MATLAQKLDLLRGVLDGKRAFCGPFYADVDVTRRCNLACIGCQYHVSGVRTPAASDRSVQDISLSLVRQLVDAFRTAGTGEVFLTGEGEPLLHPELPAIVAAFKGGGAKVHLFTNGTLLDESVARALVESRLDVLRVSLWGSTAAEYRASQARGQAGSVDKLERTLAGVRAVIAARARRRADVPTVVLMQPIARFNHRGLRQRTRLARSLGCDGVSFSALRHWGEEFRSAALSQEEVREVERVLEAERGRLESLGVSHNIDRLRLRYRLGAEAWRTLPCYAGWFYTRVRVDGTVVPCQSCDFGLGNVAESGFQAVWNGDGYQSFRHRVSRPRGLAELADRCDCSWCCYVPDNHAVHRVARWIPGRSAS